MPETNDDVKNFPDNRANFLLFDSQKEYIDLMTDQQAGQLLKALYAKNRGNEISFSDPMVQMAFMMVWQAVTNGRIRREIMRQNGCKGGRPKNNTEPNQNQNKTKQEPSQNQNKNEQQANEKHNNYNNNIIPPISPNGDIPPKGGEAREIKKPKENLASVLDEQPTELIPALTEFVNHRKSIKKPLTAHALRLNIADLQRLAPNDIPRQKELVEYAIKKGWQGFYLPSEEQSLPGLAHAPRPTSYAQQLKLEQDQQARALLAASQRRENDAQLIGDGRTDNPSELAVPPEWRAI
jgi:hypothetical protein